MKTKVLSLLLFLFFPFIILGQSKKSPKNLSKAVAYLNRTTSDSLKNAIKSWGKDSIRAATYAWERELDIVYRWTKKYNATSRVKRYLNKRGIFYHQTEVILIAFKDYLNHGSFHEKAILQSYQAIELRWKHEDAHRYTIDTLRGIHIPADLDECYRQLDQLLADSTRIKFKAMPEREFTSRVHFGLGRWLRNHWQLWGGSRLSQYFNDLDVTHADDMSGIILVSYHRYLNQQDIKLEEQLKNSVNFWKKYERIEKENLEKNKLIFQEFQIGDTLEFRYNHGFSTKRQEEKWMDDHCIAQGVLLKKDSTTLKLKVKVIQSCDKKGIIYFNNEDHLIYNKKTKTSSPPRKTKKKYLKERKSKWFEIEDWYPK